LEYLVVDTRSAVPLYVQILDQIRGRAGDGALPPGTPLPSVRQLASDLSINPNTVAKAYMFLEREGIIHTVRRRGTFVSDMARTKAREIADQRLGEALDRVLQEAAAFGMDQKQLLDAMKQRLRREDPRKRPSGGM